MLTFDINVDIINIIYIYGKKYYIFILKGITMSINKIKKVLPFFVIGLILIGVYFFVTQNKNSSEPIEREETTYAVEAFEASPRNVESSLEYTALIQPSETEQVMFSTIGTIETIHVKEGDSVTVGQVLVSLEDETAKNQETSAYEEMQSAQSNVNSTKSEYDSARNEYNAHLENVGNDADIIQAKSNWEEAVIERDKIQSELDVINENLKPYTDAVDVAQAELTEATEEYYAALEALGEDTENEEKIEAEKLARENYDAKSEALAQATEKSFQEAVSAGKYEKESELSSAETQVVTTRAIYESLNTEYDVRTQTLSSRVDTTKFAYESSVSIYESRQSSYETAKDYVESLTYTAKTDGTVIMVVGSEGAVATPLAPVLVIGSLDTVAQFGLSAEDVGKVNVGNSATIKIKDELYSGEIKNISVIPDEVSRTYLTNVLIKMTPDELLLGELVSVKISVGEMEGMWLPLNIILNDGQDYVFTVENDRAVRTNIEILDVNNDEVLVEGIVNGQLIISKGMKSLKSGYLISVVE